MPTINLEAGLRQPIEELMARGYTGPWVVFCNKLAYASGEYDTELGKVIVHSNLFYMPIEDLSVTTLTEYERYLAENPPDGPSQ